MIGNRLGDRAVSRIIKTGIAEIGLDLSRYCGHSFSSGLPTSIAAAGAFERSIMNQTGHASLPMMRRYIKEGSLFLENRAAVVGL